MAGIDGGYCMGGRGGGAMVKQVAADRGVDWEGGRENDLFAIYLCWDGVHIGGRHGGVKLRFAGFV